MDISSTLHFILAVLLYLLTTLITTTYSHPIQVTFNSILTKTDYSFPLSTVPNMTISNKYTKGYYSQDFNSILDIFISPDDTSKPMPLSVNLDEHPLPNITPEDIYKESHKRLPFHFKIHENVYLLFGSMLAKYPDHQEFYLKDHCHRIRPGTRKSLTFKGSYDLVIGIAHGYTHIFGHFIADYFQYLVLLPTKLLQKAYLKSTIRQNYNEYYEMIGINKNQLIKLRDNEYIFVRHYVGAHQLTCGPVDIYNSRHLRKLLYKKLNLSGKKPYRFIYHMRKKRALKNELFMENLTAIFPGLKWEVISPEDHKNLKQSAELFSETLLFLTTHGSEIANVIFMQEGTALCCIERKDTGKFFEFFCFGLGIHRITMQDATLLMHRKSNYPIPFRFVKILIETGLRAVGR